MDISKEALLSRGARLVTRFCRLNRLEPPEIKLVTKNSRLSTVSVCAWYRPPRDIWIKVWACASTTRDEGRYRWSYPGYTVDRTPYGVLAHELGHHIDRNNLSGIFDDEVNEKPISGYGHCNPRETFAEFFKVFITDPDLLGLIRPQTYRFLCRRFKPIETRPWQEVLRHAPLKILQRCERLTGETR